MLVHPQVQARTVEIQRVVVQLPREAQITEESEEVGTDAKLEKRRQFYRGFWSELLSELQLDDTSQPYANPTQSENVFFLLPPSGQIEWISVFFAQKTDTVGVYLRFSQSLGSELYERLVSEKDGIEDEIGLELTWKVRSETSQNISCVKHFPDVWSPTNREQIKKFFSETVNAFVNTFRPRLERYVEELDA